MRVQWSHIGNEIEEHSPVSVVFLHFLTVLAFVLDPIHLREMRRYPILMRELPCTANVVPGTLLPLNDVVYDALVWNNEFRAADVAISQFRSYITNSSSSSIPGGDLLPNHSKLSMIKEDPVLSLETDNKVNSSAGPTSATNYSAQETAYMVNMDFPFCNHCHKRAQLLEVR